ncbi:uncharacterized protein CLUP02_09290 [Colletotrichum lupini]|uniref:Uncharacterized protein n=1 Tax=Colletotrichum lupini TaxID=145971 RepID=A0A9Q8SUI5_9PEZI|nr:uncharacterized protein CLUP02_09290 [Colletotrichum lupini]UQC83794.1 hypothetical protein CLUP02_09290 [Colletotrichum lupini]
METGPHKLLSCEQELVPRIPRICFFTYLKHSEPGVRTRCNCPIQTQIEEASGSWESNPFKIREWEIDADRIIFVEKIAKRKERMPIVAGSHHAQTIDGSRKAGPGKGTSLRASSAPPYLIRVPEHCGQGEVSLTFPTDSLFNCQSTAATIPI